MATGTPTRWAAYVACWLVLFLSACEAVSTTRTNEPGTTSQATTTIAGPTTTTGPERWRTHYRVSGYQAGTYWWNPATTVFLHNPTEGARWSAGVELLIGAPPPAGECMWIDSDFRCVELETVPAVLAGYQGTYLQTVRRQCEMGMPNCVEVRHQVWVVDIEDTELMIHLSAQQDVTGAELAEGQAIVDSIRIEPWENDAGFRMIFTIPDGWDSA